jgi:hypothetical protein
MENASFSHVADLSHEQRTAVESIVGEALHPDDQLFVAVLHPNREPSTEAKSRARSRLDRLFAESQGRALDSRATDDEAESIINEAVHKVRSHGT